MWTLEALQLTVWCMCCSLAPRRESIKKLQSLGEAAKGYDMSVAQPPEIDQVTYQGGMYVFKGKRYNICKPYLSLAMLLWLLCTMVLMQQRSSGDDRVYAAYYSFCRFVCERLLQ